MWNNYNKVFSDEPNVPLLHRETILGPHSAGSSVTLFTSPSQTQDKPVMAGRGIHGNNGVMLEIPAISLPLELCVHVCIAGPLCPLCYGNQLHPGSVISPSEP